GGLDGTQLRFDDSGLPASAGQTVRKLAPVGLTAVVFVAIPTAVPGIVQFPLLPHTWNVTVSAAPSGVPRPPTWSVDRVSTRRQGVIGTNVDGVGEVAAPTSPISTIEPARATSRPAPIFRKPAVRAGVGRGVRRRDCIVLVSSLRCSRLWSGVEVDRPRQAVEARPGELMGGDDAGSSAGEARREQFVVGKPGGVDQLQV